MKRQYGDKVGFEFTIHSYHRREISHSELTTKQLIETLKFN